MSLVCVAVLRNRFRAGPPELMKVKGTKLSGHNDAVGDVLIINLLCVLYSIKRYPYANPYLSGF